MPVRNDDEFAAVELRTLLRDTQKLQNMIEENESLKVRIKEMNDTIENLRQERKRLRTENSLLRSALCI